MRVLRIHDFDTADSALMDPGLWSAISPVSLADSPAAVRQLYEDDLRGYYALWPVFSEPDDRPALRRLLIRATDLETARRAALLARISETVSNASQSVECISWTELVSRPVVQMLIEEFTGGLEAAALLRAASDVLAPMRLTFPSMDAGLQAKRGQMAFEEWLGFALSHFEASNEPPLIRELREWALTDFRSAAAILAQVVSGAVDPMIAGLDGAARYGTGHLGLSPRQAANEVVRIVTPFQSASRYVRSISPLTESIGLRVGDKVVVALADANREQARYPDPECPASGRPRHIAFGRGPHRCPGSNMALLVISQVLETLAERRIRFDVDPATTPGRGLDLGCVYGTFVEVDQVQREGSSRCPTDLPGERGVPPR